MIDNTKLIREKLLDFKEPGDFYVAHVIQRAKDKRAAGTLNPGDTRDESQRLIKTWYIDARDYFEKKLPIMKEVADANHARLYFMPQVRNKLTVNRVLAKEIIDAIDETGIRYDHLIRTAVCGCHASRQKMWILDVDDEDFGGHELARKFADVLDEEIFRWAQHAGGPGGTAYMARIYETRNGWGVVTKPFDVRILTKEGVQHVTLWDETPFGGRIQKFLEEHPECKFSQDKVLLKDAMMLAYCGF